MLYIIFINKITEKITRFNWFICWQVLAVAYKKIMTCGLPFNTTKWQDNPHNDTNQQTNQISIFTQQHVKTIPGSPRTASYLVKLMPKCFTPKYLNTKSTKQNAFSTNKTIILVVTVHFQRITFHSSILKCKPNDLFTTSNKPSDDLVCANATWLHHCRMV